MDAKRSNQVWLFGGVLLIVALVAASWFLVISPKFTQADDVRNETDTAGIQLIKLKKDIAALESEEKKKTTLVADLAASRTALPSSYNIPAFLRQVQDSGAAVNVDISGFGVSAPVAVVGIASAVELPITLTAAGTAADLSDFLTRLQNVQSRAVLIKSISFGPGESGAGASVNLGLSAYCLQPATVTTTNNCKAG